MNTSALKHIFERNGTMVTDDNGDQIKIDGPAGIGLTFKGQQMFPAILVILMSMVFGYLFYTQNTKEEERYKVQVVALQAVESAMIKADQTQQTMIYVLSLSQADREKLNLLKPRQLTDMQR